MSELDYKFLSFILPTYADRSQSLSGHRTKATDRRNSTLPNDISQIYQLVFDV